MNVSWGSTPMYKGIDDSLKVVDSSIYQHGRLLLFTSAPVIH